LMKKKKQHAKKGNAGHSTLFRPSIDGKASTFFPSLSPRPPPIEPLSLSTPVKSFLEHTHTHARAQQSSSSEFPRAWPAVPPL